MRLLILTFLCALSLSVTAACPLEDDQITKISGPLGKKFEKLCGQGIKLGGQADVDFVKKHILSYYTSKAFLGKELPAGWENDVNKIIEKCHKNTYNYCIKATREKVGECVKSEAMAMIPKYALQVPAYCPYVEKIVSEWPSKHEAKAMKLISKVCAMNGKKC